MSRYGRAAENSFRALKSRAGSSLRHGDAAGEPEGIVAHPGDLKLHASTAILAKDIATLLRKHFPGFRWALQASDFGGVFRVYNLDFNTKWAYIIRYGDIMDDPQRRAALRAGNELLRRFGWIGNRFDPKQLAALPRDAHGEVPPITSGLKKTRHTLAAELERALATGHARIVRQSSAGSIVEMRK
jgi:hypothetical protein